VTQVQGAPAPVEPGAEGGTETASAGSAVPTSSLMITVAVTAAQAEALVFGVEHGTLWLSLQPEGARTDGGDVVTGGNIYEKDLS
jgi:pilus assembly protein CpaB